MHKSLPSEMSSTKNEISTFNKTLGETHKGSQTCLLQAGVWIQQVKYKKNMESRSNSNRLPKDSLYLLKSPNIIPLTW